MMKLPQLALFAALLLAASPQGHAAAPAASKQQQVDALFAKWNSSDTPGAAVEVAKDGKVIYRHAFGMAEILARS